MENETIMKDYYIGEKLVDYEEFLIALNSGRYRVSETTEKYVKIIEGNPEREIQVLKQKLVETDYKALKFAEGYLTEAEYAATKAQRQAWRDEINALEAKLQEAAL